jgi:hypothetical protein
MENDTMLLSFPLPWSNRVIPDSTAVLHSISIQTLAVSQAPAERAISSARLL